jgi:hypothetical protein
LATTPSNWIKSFRLKMLLPRHKSLNKGCRLDSDALN